MVDPYTLLLAQPFFWFQGDHLQSIEVLVGEAVGEATGAEAATAEDDFYWRAKWALKWTGFAQQ